MIRFDVFNGAELTVRAIVEHRVEPPLGDGENPIERGIDALRGIIVEVNCFEPLVGERAYVLDLVNAGEHPPAACLQAECRVTADAGRTAGDEDRRDRQGPRPIVSKNINILNNIKRQVAGRVANETAIIWFRMVAIVRLGA